MAAQYLGMERSTDQRERASVLLRQADVFVRKGNYTSALEAIVNARSTDPGHPYAVAYDERVRALLQAQEEEVAEKLRASKEGVNQYLTNARYYLLQNQFSNALEQVALAYTVNPDDVNVHRTKNEIMDAMKEEQQHRRVRAEDQYLAA